jgi:hypothetical protein
MISIDSKKRKDRLKCSKHKITKNNKPKLKLTALKILSNKQNNEGWLLTTKWNNSRPNGQCKKKTS